MKLLIIQTAFIGDVILATALIEKLHRFYPNAKIDFLLRKGNESLLANHPYLRKVWIWDKKSGKYTSWLKLAQQIRAEKYDTVINCQRFASSGLLTVLSKAKQTVGFNKNPFSFLFTRSIQHKIGPGNSRFGLPYYHEVDRNLDLIDHLTDRSAEKPALYPGSSSQQNAQDIGAHPYVCIAPTSVWHTKQWPAEKWIALIKKIPDSVTIYLLGGTEDAHACENIQKNASHQRIHNLAGKINLLTSAALMKEARMNFVNDSSPMHLASSVNAPVTAVFCSTVPQFGFTPLSDQAIIWELETPLDCRPCGLHGKKECPYQHFKCAVEIKIPNALTYLPLS
jgi:heptosyltransferase-2